MPAYHYPGTLDEACAQLADGEETMVYGGGTAIQILVKQGLLFATDLVDVGRLPGLADITETAAGLRVGPLVTLRRMETDPLVRSVAPLAAHVYGQVANPRVRNTASVAGNIAHGDYRLDPPTALLVLDASVEITSATGRRVVPVREFFVDFQQTALTKGDVITAIEIPRQPESSGGWFAKLSSLSTNDWPCATTAALVVAGPGRTREVRLGLGALAHMPMFTRFEVPADSDVDDVVAAAHTAAAPFIDPIPDVRGGSAFKRRLGLVAVEEAVRGSWKEQDSDDGATTDTGRGAFHRWRRRR